MSLELKNDLKRSKRAELLAMVNELKRRGLKVPDVKSVVRFPVDDDGYFVRYDGKTYDPNDEQYGFVWSEAAFSAIFSGRGGGKSAAGTQKALHKISKGESGAVLNPDFENFKISTWPEFREWIPWETVVPNQRYRGEQSWEPHQPFTLTFINGARVLCKGLKDPDSARGPNINWLWYDEAGRDPDGLAWQIALASVRVGEDIQAWVTTTPKGKAHWLYKFFVKQEIPEDARDAFEKVAGDRPFIEYFHTSIWENEKHLNPVFFANMLVAYPKGFLRERELEGRFSDEGGTIGDSSWFHGKVVPAPPQTVSGRIRYWDLAASEKKVVGRKRSDPDATCGTLMSWQKDGHKDEKGVIQIGKFFIEDQVTGRWLYDDILDVIIETAEKDGPYVRIYIEQEPGAGGKNQVAAIAKHVRETLGNMWKVEGHNPRDHGDKIMRANVWFAEASHGQFFMVFGDWNKPMLDQLDEFPDGKHDDRIDSISGARHVLAPVKLWKSIKFMHI
jgi:predicted phage terminase large subunit-like protein